MTTVERLTGAIIGLNILMDKVIEIENGEKYKRFSISSTTLKDFIEYKRNIFKDIKIKELEKQIKQR